MKIKFVSDPGRMVRQASTNKVLFVFDKKGEYTLETDDYPSELVDKLKNIFKQKTVKNKKKGA